jgi:hypothetical protein
MISVAFQQNRFATKEVDTPQAVLCVPDDGEPGRDSHRGVRHPPSRLAKREGLNDSYVRRLVRLAFLSPTIIEAICAGWQPADLTAQGLTRDADVPLG